MLENVGKLFKISALIFNFYSQDDVIQLTEAGGQATGTCSSMKFANETAIIRIVWPNVTLQVNFTGGDVWYMSGVKIGVGSK